MGLFSLFLGGSKDNQEDNKNQSCIEDYDDVLDGDDDTGEYISAYEAAQIWLSSGMDEDQMFGYSRDELEDAM